MMSFSMVKSASGADHYFMETDNYYLKSDEYADRFQWWGQGAEKLGLNGKIDRDIFLNILQGKLPNGAEIPGSVNGERRPGFDLTFSAPKSVSILALVYGKEELIEAHQQAVDEVLKVIEQTAAQARIQGENGSEIELTRNLIVAKFLHDSSRDLDPNLHTHALAMNATERSDGEWRALASTMEENVQLKGFFKHIYDDQIFYSTIYRSALANILVKLGYEIEMLPENEGGRHGMFEIKGFPKDLKENFSKRRAEIEKLIEEYESKSGDASAKTTDFITLTSRKAKEAVDRKELHESWMDDIRDKFPDFNPDMLKGQAKDQKQEINPSVAVEAVIEATRHFGESRLSFTYKDLATKSLQFKMGQASFEDINTAIDYLRSENFLVSMSESEMTSKEILTLEHSMIAKAQSVLKKGTAGEVNESVLSKMEISDHQKNLVQNLLESKSGISIVNMSLYDHPEEFLEAFLNTAEHSGRKVTILTPTKTSSNDLQKNIHRRSFSAWNWVVNVLNKPESAQTVRGYLFRNQDQDFFSNLLARKGKDILVVDAAHRIGNQDLDGLLSVAETKNAKIILLNSKDALKGGVAGTPIELLKKIKVEEHELSDNKLPKSAVNTAILEITDEKERAETIAKKYASIPEANQRDTHVVAHTNKQADLINHEIREALKNRGQLSRNEFSFRTLSPVYLSGAEKKFATQYQNDMVLKHFDKGGVNTYLVLKYFEEDNSVLLLSEKQEKVLWNPAKSNWRTMLYKKGELGVVEGDRLIATDNMRHLNVESGHQLKINSIGKNEIEILNAGTGEIIKVEPSQLRDSSLKYAYATTILSANKERRSHLIADIKGFAANQEMMNELKSRATKSIDILTDSKEKLELQSEKAQLKTTATDTLITKQEDVPELKKFISKDTIKDFEKDFDQIATILCDQFNGIDKRTLTQKSLEYMVSKLSERDAAFKHHDLLTEALKYGIEEQSISKTSEQISIDSLRSELKSYRDEGKLLLSNDHTYWVTREALECEREGIKLSKDGIGQVKNLLSAEEAFETLNKTNLTKGQKDAAHLILTTQDRFVIVQGDPGTGKTSMASQVKEVVDHLNTTITEQGIVIKGVAPTHPAVKELEAIGIQAQTLKSFLIEYQQMKDENKALPDNNKTLFILDEYSMLSSEDARDFKRIVTSTNGRAAHLGDIKQFQGVQAGTPMDNDIKAGIKTAYMEETVRQKNEEAKNIAKAAIKGDVAGVFEAAEKQDVKKFIQRDEDRMTYVEKKLIAKSVIENGDVSINEACAREYVLRIPEIRAKSPVIIQTHKDRAEVNAIIRQELKDNNELPKEGEIQINRLVRIDLKKTDIKETRIDNATHLRLGNSYYKIEKVDQKNKAFLLRNEEGKIEAFDPKRDFLRYKGNYEAFQLVQQEIVQNDLIMLRKNDPKRGHRANDDYLVKAIEGKNIHLENVSDGTKVVLDTDMLRDAHWDYGYSKTSFQMQGASKFYPIFHLTKNDEKLAHVRTMCVGATRHGHHLMIITDDKEEVIKKFSRQNDKLSAMEVMGELPKSNKGKDESSKPEKSSLNQKGKQSAFGLKQATKSPNSIDNKQANKPQNTVEIVERFDAKDIELRLNAQAETVVEHLLGQRNSALSRGNEWRYGKKGSLSVKVSGEHCGNWHNFETGERGNLLTLIQNELGLDFKEALRYGANLVGGAKVDIIKRQLKSKEETEKSKNIDAWKDKEVARYFKEAIAVEGTLAEKYLKEHRGLSDINGKDLRFHPKLYSHKEEKQDGTKGKNIYHPGLVSFALDTDGNPVGMQAVFLDEKTGNKRSDVPLAKKSLGHFIDTHITITNGSKEDKVTFIAEGVETAMSIRDAAPGHHVIATLSKSNFKNVDPNRLAKIVFLCMDNDMAGTIRYGKSVNDSIEKLKKAGKEVFVVMPKKEGADFNDVLKKDGKEGVQKELKNKLSGEKFKERMAAFEKDTAFAKKIADKDKKNEILNKVSRKELDRLMRDFDHAKTVRNSQPQKQIEKIKSIRDREIG